MTGAAGFLASHVADSLLDRGHEVQVVDVRPPRPEIASRPRLSYEAADLTDRASLERAFAGCDAVCHLAGVGDVYLAGKEPATAAMLNVVGTANVAEAALAVGAKRLVYASTWEVYGEPEYQPIDEGHPCRPDHPYNITKYAGERIALSIGAVRDLPTIALRLGTAFGPRMRPNSVFSIFIDRALKGEPITIQGTGAQSRQFTHARDVAVGFALAVESSLPTGVFNLVADESVSVRQLAEMVVARIPTTLTFVPGRAGEIAPAQVANARAKTALGWTPRAVFAEGLDEMIAISRRQKGAVQ